MEHCCCLVLDAQSHWPIPHISCVDLQVGPSCPTLYITPNPPIKSSTNKAPNALVSSHLGLISQILTRFLKSRGMGSKMTGKYVANQSEDDMCVRKGPWTVEEDTILANYVATHGEGRWNFVARCAGLNRTGKSCRLRWLNYLRPDVRRGNITFQEQILILDLHSRWGNRWSKIAEHLPGRTDNEIKNYWRTRVIKQAKQLKCEVNSKQFRDALRYVWIPRLLERIRASSEDQPGSGTERRRPSYCCTPGYAGPELRVSSNSDSSETTVHPIGNGSVNQAAEQGDPPENLWSDENIWFLRQQLCDGF